MSHISLKTARKSHSFKLFLYGCLFLILFTALDIFTTSAHAATTTSIHKSTQTYVLKSDLAELSPLKQATLDWREQSYELNFNLPAYDWYETLDLFLSAHPEGNVGHNTPLMISYNGADPIALNGQGSQFEAHIRLDPSRIRAAGNTIKITYQDGSCLTPQHGKWILNLSKSKLVAKARPKRRALYMSEIEQRLNHPMTSPKRVAILAKGQNTSALEAIIAQGMAQRTHTLPNFQLTHNNADFTVLIGTHKKIKNLVNDKSRLEGDTAIAFLDTSKRPKLVLSAKNEAQLTELARAFSRYHLPSARKSSVSLYELYSNLELSAHTALTAKTYALSEIGNINLAPSWAPQPAQFKFNTLNSQESSAQLTLHLEASKNTNPKSKLRVNLNEHAIGYTYLNKKKKKVVFDIPSDVLKATNNILNITPAFQEDDAITSCSAQSVLPSVILGARSKLAIDSETEQAPDNLNNLTANGGPFTNTNAKTALVLTAQSTKDKLATLQFLGFAARQFGPHWVDADYFVKLPNASTDSNILFIGPNALQNPTLIAAAPRAVKLALGGKPVTGTSNKEIAMFQKHTSKDADQAFQTLASAINSQARINTGGIASIFPSPYANNKMIGIFSATKANYFATAMQSLSTQEYWNALQGSVTRWDKSSVLMAQISPPIPSEPKPFNIDFPNWMQTLPPLKLKTHTNYKASIIHWIDAHLQANHIRPQPELPQLKLRSTSGSIPVPTLKSFAVQKNNSRALALPKAAGFPNIAGAKSKVSQWTKTVSNSVYIPSWKNMSQKLVHNRALILILIVLSVFFIAGSIPSRRTSRR